MPLNSREKRELEKQFRRLNSKVCLLKEEDTDIQAELDLKADLVGGVVPTNQLPITQDIIDALNNANAPDGTNYFTTLADLSSITPGTLINVANNYSALPAANTVSGEFYWVENAQGTSWLPGPLGGTYYPNGLYYSNGTTWIFTDMPYNATQVEVDAGLNNNKFVTPQTFTNASKWGTKFDNWTVTTANTGTLTGKNVLWLADTSAARTRDLDPTGNYAHIKDTTGNASTNNITVNAPIGQTINGNASETIDSDFGWVEYKLVGTDWVTTEGDSGASTNQLIIDSIPTNGSTNPVSSDGVFDALALKQDLLTNPVTGTGTAGQVSYWSGTNTQTGSASFTFISSLNTLYVGAANSTNGTLRIERSGGSNAFRFDGSDGGLFSAGSWKAYEPYNYATADHNFNIAHPTIGSFNWSSGTNSNLSLNTQLMKLTRTGELGIGTTTATPTARLHVRGSGTTSATTALLVQNSTPTDIFQITDNGFARFRSSLITFFGVTTPFTILHRGDITDGISFGQNSDTTITSGNRNTFLITESFIPTSGTATLNVQRIAPSINQTGGANGITRGLYVNPTLTSAADWRSIETSNNTGYAIYAAGTANSYLAGSLGIGSTSLVNTNLRLSKNITGASTSYILLGSGEIRSDVTSSARLISVGATTQAAAFNLTNAQIFFAEGIATSGIGAGSSITNQMAFHAHSTLTGATNNYGFYGNIASGTGRWNLYMNGTAANYLAGNTSIGTTTSSGRLTVQGSGTTSATNGLLVEDSAGTDNFTIRDDGGYAFRGGTVGLAQTGYTTFTNLTTDRTCDANATTVEELADILGTLIEDLKTKGIISA